MDTCICQTLRLTCKHNLLICTCTFCRIKAAPTQDFSLGHCNYHPLLLKAIIETAHIKQRTLPANMRYWSEKFAIKYLRFLDELPAYRETLPRLEQFDAEHRRGDDVFNATRRTYRGEYWKSNCQDENDKPLQSENEKAQEALLERSND